MPKTLILSKPNASGQLLNRLDVGRIVIAYGVDLLVHGIKDQVLYGMGLQDPAESLRIAIGWVEPWGVDLRVQDHGHAVMELADRAGGVAGDDGAGADFLVVVLFVVPGLPEAGEGEGGLVGQGDEHGLFLAFPFIKAVGQDQAAALFEGLAKGGLGGHTKSVPSASCCRRISLAF